ncbi:hypothetical protein DN069_11455 [Streptacidiphilus pinicola]|uniref:Uncharacterized protein n=1 Tax=Streptacidiphilus pinicola TaxID=2219663 RepID=A0A2X0IK76_9ACTN|nr:hypothetical protein [Streptacidiphilus pinicola]RAG85544.1 hypothetical protein DN069_11455 [Streptacidiphilus pinicola]
MTSDGEAQLRADRLLVAEAHDVAEGWHFLTVENLAPNGRADALLYEEALDAFDRAVGTRECRHRGRVHGLTFGIRGDHAEQRIAWLRRRLEALRPPALPGFGTWDIRDGAR